VWGVTMEEAFNSSTMDGILPSPVVNLSRWIFKYGLKGEGLFRVPGSLERVHWIRDQFNKDPAFEPEPDESIANVASALKDWKTEVADKYGKRCGMLGGEVATEDIMKRSRVFIETYQKVSKPSQYDYDGEGGPIDEPEQARRAAEILAKWLHPSAVRSMWFLMRLCEEAAQYEEHNLMDYGKLLQYGLFVNDMNIVSICSSYESEVRAHYHTLISPEDVQAEEDMFRLMQNDDSTFGFNFTV